ncbi:30S ribosomal protein S13 [Candidatus Woesearchaeota archaeon]|nr:MAG: 30S ribosomal protein S13 [Candidatus Woesearchaeota archaeon]
MAEENFKHIIRVANTDLKGEKQISFALQKIKGVGTMFSHMVCRVAKVPKEKKAGTLNDKEVKALEEAILDPKKFSVPSWLYNRRKDYETGEDTHIISGDLKFIKENDVKRLQKTKSYKGLRLAVGLPVRGQRTKSNFRRTKGKGLGVKKKK